MTNSVGTYGLSKGMRGAPRMGTGLQGMANNEEAEATGLLRTAAQTEQNRNLGNEQRYREAKAGAAQLGSTVGGLAGGAIAGAQFGSAAGPYGMAIGAVFGALASGAF